MLTSLLGILPLRHVCLATSFCLLVLVAPCGSKVTAAAAGGMPYDWSHHYLIFSNPSSPAARAAVQGDLRFWQQQVRMSPIGTALAVPAVRQKRQHVDWSVNLGGAGSTIAPGMYPAKYSFDVNAVPSCTNDYVVFALNVTGSAAQATIVGYNNLYSEPGGTGFCPGTGPAVKWAYNTGGATATSSTLSVDGKKVAWVSNTNPPVFHVLTIGTTGSNGTSVTTPAVAGVGNNAVDTAISYGSLGDTRSSPFVDYTHDVAYVASDDGVIHKFSGVFRGTPAQVITGGWPLHIIDAGNRKIAGPVFDFVSKNLYWVDDVGTFSYFREVGSTVGVCIGQPVPPCWGQVTYSLTGTARPLAEPPIVDSTLQRIYVFVGDDNQGHADVLQTDTQLSSFGPEATLGKNGASLFAGAFDHNYFSSPQTGFLYVCGYPTLSPNSSPVLYRVGFNSTGKMNASHDANSLALALGTVNTRCSPMTEIFNTSTGKDWLFAGMETGCVAAGGFPCLMSLDITAGFPTAVSQARREAGGTSGIVVDNVSLLPQASSIYFTTLGNTTCGDGVAGGGCAVKLTQAGLN